MSVACSWTCLPDYLGTRGPIATQRDVELGCWLFDSGGAMARLLIVARRNPGELPIG
jgi:hypothetical protein